MSRLVLSLGLSFAFLASFAGSPARAQGSGHAPSPAVCQCGGYPGPHYHLTPPAPGYAPQAGYGPVHPTIRGGTAMGGGAVNPSDAGPIYGLPRGRRYYGGRYFGSFNNRFYGPQYGNF